MPKPGSGWGFRTMAPTAVPQISYDHDPSVPLELEAAIVFGIVLCVVIFATYFEDTFARRAHEPPHPPIG